MEALPCPGGSTSGISPDALRITARRRPVLLTRAVRDGTSPASNAGQDPPKSDAYTIWLCHGALLLSIRYPCTILHLHRPFSCRGLWTLDCPGRWLSSSAITDPSTRESEAKAPSCRGGGGVAVREGQIQLRNCGKIAVP